MKWKIAVFIGSLRKESYNRRLAELLISLAPPSLKMNIIEIGHLPFYNQDEDEHPPESWRSFREQVKNFDGVLFLTPEYNRSIPAVLKNAIDVGSRPYGKSIWSGKPCAVISSSPGAIGGFGANHHLRQSLVFLNMPCMQQPEAYIGSVNTLLDEQTDGTKKYLGSFMESFHKWVETNATAR